MMHAVHTAVICASIDRTSIHLESRQCSLRALLCFEKVGGGRRILMGEGRREYGQNARFFARRTSSAESSHSRTLCVTGEFKRGLKIYGVEPGAPRGRSEMVKSVALVSLIHESRPMYVEVLYERLGLR